MSTDWTGSAAQRREQRGCKPPERAPNLTPSFTIPAGAKAQVRKVTEANWQPYITRAVTRFDRAEEDRRYSYVFRYEGYLLQSAKKLVIKGTSP